MKIGKAATESAEKILVKIYGEDLTGCSVSLEEVSRIIQQGISSETKDYRALAEALIGAIRQIQAVATPPDKSEVSNLGELAAVLGERADAIRDISGKILQAWDEFEQQQKS